MAHILKLSVFCHFIELRKHAGFADVSKYKKYDMIQFICLKTKKPVLVLIVHTSGIDLLLFVKLMAFVKKVFRSKISGFFFCTGNFQASKCKKKTF